MFLLAILVIAFTAMVAALNWTAFTTPTSLWMGIAVVEAPLGIVMLVLAGLLTLILGGMAVAARAARSRDERRFQQELAAQRDLADRAEVSRIAELRKQLEADAARIHELSAAHQAAIFGRIDQLERSTRESIEESANSLSAYIGEMEDRFERRVSDPNWVPEHQRDVGARYVGEQRPR